MRSKLHIQTTHNTAETISGTPTGGGRQSLADKRHF